MIKQQIEDLRAYLKRVMNAPSTRADFLDAMRNVRTTLGEILYTKVPDHPASQIVRKNGSGVYENIGWQVYPAGTQFYTLEQLLLGRTPKPKPEPTPEPVPEVMYAKFDKAMLRGFVNKMEPLMLMARSWAIHYGGIDHGGKIHPTHAKFLDVGSDMVESLRDFEELPQMPEIETGAVQILAENFAISGATSCTHAADVGDKSIAVHVTSADRWNERTDNTDQAMKMLCALEDKIGHISWDSNGVTRVTWDGAITAVLNQIEILKKELQDEAIGD